MGVVGRCPDVVGEGGAGRPSSWRATPQVSGGPDWLRLDGVDQLVLSLTARGLTTGEVAAHFMDVYGANVPRDTISRITEKVAGEMVEWKHRPLDRVYPAMLIDAIVLKVRDGSKACEVPPHMPRHHLTRPRSVVTYGQGIPHQAVWRDGRPRIGLSWQVEGNRRG